MEAVDKQLNHVMSHSPYLGMDASGRRCNRASVLVGLSAHEVQFFLPVSRLTRSDRSQKGIDPLEFLMRFV